MNEKIYSHGPTKSLASDTYRLPKKDKRKTEDGIGHGVKFWRVKCEPRLPLLSSSELGICGA